MMEVLSFFFISFYFISFHFLFHFIYFFQFFFFLFFFSPDRDIDNAPFFFLLLSLILNDPEPEKPVDVKKFFIQIGDDVKKVELKASPPLLPAVKKFDLLLVVFVRALVQ